MKKKMLIIGITMAAAGSEKSFLSFAKTAIDFEKYEVDLLLAKKTGDTVKQGDVIGTIYSNDKSKLEDAKSHFVSAVTVSDSKPDLLPLILGEYC